MATISKVGPTISRTGIRYVGGLANGNHWYTVCNCKYGPTNIQLNKWRAQSVCNPVIQPIVQQSLEKVGPCGGSGGQPRDMDPTGISRIVKVGLRHCDTVDALIVHFERNGLQECTSLWGEHGGQLTEFYLQPNEYITSIKGHLGYFKNIYLVRSLTLETNLAIYGPYGQEDGIPFELPAIDGEIIGFHGRSGTYLDAIGIYIKVANTEGDSNMDTSISISTSTVIVEETDGISLVEGTGEIVEETVEESTTDTITSTTTTVYEGKYGARLDLR